MSEKYLHIISFVIPFPVNYGGVFDIFHKIVALHKAGVKIYLHCFNQHNHQEPELNKYCRKVFYYPRKTGVKGMSLKLPYIVSSRISNKLSDRLAQDNHPVLIEGIHSSGWLLNQNTSTRKIILRLHNVEHEYYSRLFSTSSSLIKKAYYRAEAAMLKRFEKKIAHKPSLILAVSEHDKQTYQHRFNVSDIDVLPVFTGFSNDTPPGGNGKYCLYHGNLSVAENDKAVQWLLHNVFNKIDFPVIIAGRKPSSAVKQTISALKNVQLVKNPSYKEMQQLLANAQCNVLPSFNITGVKLKIINALFHGRHCIVNDAAVDGSGLQPMCHIANTATEVINTIARLYDQPIAPAEIASRKNMLKEMFDEEKNCHRLIQWIW